MMGDELHSLPMGKLFTARAFIGVIGGLRNLLSELLEVTTRNGIYFIWCDEPSSAADDIFFKLCSVLLS
jgi:hypothetical protein